MRELNRQTNLVFGLMCLASAGAVNAQDDVIYLLSQAGSSTVRGKIVAQSPAEVTVDSRGAMRKVSVDSIRKITFAGETIDLRRAKDLIRDGQLDRALQGLEKINRNDVSRTEILQDVQYLKALCRSRMALQSGTGMRDAAREVYSFLRANPKSYHYFEGQELFGDLAMALQQYKAAAVAYAEIEKAPWPAMRMRGALLQGRALLDQEEYASASARFESVIKNTESTATALREKNLAKIGQAVCDAAIDKSEAGISALEKIIDDNDPKDTELFARAYNALGYCYRKMDRPKDALYAYLFVDMLFTQDADAHAEALYYLSGLWEQLNRNEDAASARSLLTSRYASSRWASR